MESDAQALVNTVNTVGVMGKGLALQFKEAFPDNFRLYRVACKERRVQVGRMFITEENTLNGARYIINFPTKTTWRRPSEYSYIESGLRTLRKEIIDRKIVSIAIPPLGTHNGGLEWDRVKHMIVNELQNLDCAIYLYEPSDTIVEKLKSERVRLTPARAMMLDILCDMAAYGEFASVFAAEKVVYFLERFGAKSVFNVEYVRSYYGPYSKGKISHVLYYLNGSYISGMGSMQIRPFDEFWILPETPEIVSKYLSLEENSSYREICDRVKSFLRGYYSSYSLELLSTVDFILRDDPHLAAWRSMEQDLLLDAVNSDMKKWSSRKDKLFGNNKYLPQIIKHLKEIS